MIDPLSFMKSFLGFPGLGSRGKSPVGNATPERKKHADRAKTDPEERTKRTKNETKSSSFRTNISPSPIHDELTTLMNDAKAILNETNQETGNTNLPRRMKDLTKQLNKLKTSNTDMKERVLDNIKEAQKLHFQKQINNMHVQISEAIKQHNHGQINLLEMEQKLKTIEKNLTKIEKNSIEKMKLDPLEEEEIKIKLTTIHENLKRLPQIVELNDLKFQLSQAIKRKDNAKFKQLEQELTQIESKLIKQNKLELFKEQIKEIKNFIIKNELSNLTIDLLNNAKTMKVGQGDKLLNIFSEKKEKIITRYQKQIHDDYDLTQQAKEIDTTLREIKSTLPKIDILEIIRFQVKNAIQQNDNTKLKQLDQQLTQIESELNDQTNLELKERIIGIHKERIKDTKNRIKNSINLFNLLTGELTGEKFTADYGTEHTKFILAVYKKFGTSSDFFNSIKNCLTDDKVNNTKKIELMNLAIDWYKYGAYYSEAKDPDIQSSAKELIQEALNSQDEAIKKAGASLRAEEENLRLDELRTPTDILAESQKAESVKDVLKSIKNGTINDKDQQYNEFVEDVALDLRVLFSNVRKQVDVNEFMVDSAKKNFAELAPNRYQESELFKKIQDSIASQIIYSGGKKVNSAQQQANIAKFYIDVAEKAKKNEDSQTMLLIYYVFMKDDIYKLMNNNAEVKEKLKDFDTIFSPAGNFKNLRTFCNDHNCTSSMLASKDLLFIDEANKDYEDEVGETINKKKLVLFSGVLSRLIEEKVKLQNTSNILLKTSIISELMDTKIYKK